MSGDGGNDTLRRADQRHTISGGAGNDWLNTTSSAIFLMQGDGSNDTICVLFPETHINGSMSGGSGTDSRCGGVVPGMGHTITGFEPNNSTQDCGACAL